MDNKEAIHKLEFMRNAYQKLIDEKVDSGRLVGTDVTGTWKAETPLDDAYKEHIDALSLAIAALEQQGEDNEWCLDCKEYDKEQHCCHRFTKVIRQAVEERRMEWQEQQRWIPLSEKFPQKDEDVLLQFPSNQGVGYYEDGDWMINTGDGIYSIIGYNEEKPIAWMPLPEPYGGEQNEAD